MVSVRYIEGERGASFVNVTGVGVTCCLFSRRRVCACNTHAAACGGSESVACLGM